MNLLSLYSGIGGIDLAAHWAGITSVVFCESDTFCRSVLSRHWPEVPIFESDEQVTASALRDRSIPAIDIIVGGPPCQPFSVAGKRAGATDPRHRWPEMARIVDELRPAYVLVENVAGFTDVAEQLVRADLGSLGYRTVRFDLPAAGVGAPHRRERIFVVAYAGRDEQWRQPLSLPGRAVPPEPTTNAIGQAVAHDDRSGLSGSRLHVRPWRPDEAEGDARGRGAGLAHSDLQRGDDERLGAGEVQRRLPESAGVCETMVDADERGRREPRRPTEFDATPDSGEELDIEPCPDGDGRWHVGSPWDACVNDAGLAAIRAEHADAMRHGEYGYRVADAKRVPRRPRAGHADDEARQPKPERRSSRVADANGSGRGERRGAEPIRAELGSAERSRDATMGDATRAQRIKEGIGAQSATTGERAIGHERSAAAGWVGASQSRLGRAVDVVSDRLDAACWPAPYGREQHDYEPPRVTNFREFRRKRLKALGNAVVPLQILPLLALIHELWRMEQEVVA